ncbi:hypothetical protein N9414_06709 [Nodularia spumigena CCY9414]|nr:hypothetical protein N9414_06709 [Nodularia spumigena CCY9414]
MVIGHWSLVIGHWSLVIGHWSLVIGHWSLVIGHWSLVIGHWSLVIGHGEVTVFSPCTLRPAPLPLLPTSYFLISICLAMPPGAESIKVVVAAAMMPIMARHSRTVLCLNFIAATEVSMLLSVQLT